MPLPLPRSTGDGKPAAASPLDDWDGTPGHARLLQPGLASRVELRDRFPKRLATIGGFHACFGDGGATTRATAVLLDADTLELLGSGFACLPNPLPGASDLLSFQWLPALLEALAALPRPPDLAFVDGHGIAHPQDLGIAAHFGVATGLPSIGVARSILVGSGPEPHQTRGAYTALRVGERRQIGWLLRSRPGFPPLVVSPGHRLAMGSTADLVMRFTRSDRLPEPTRLADQLASPSDPANAADPADM